MLYKWKIHNRLEVPLPLIFRIMALTSVKKSELNLLLVDIRSQIFKMFSLSHFYLSYYLIHLDCYSISDHRCIKRKMTPITIKLLPRLPKSQWTFFFPFLPSFIDKIGIWYCASLGYITKEGNSNPFQYSSLENPMDRGAWQATVLGFARVGQDLATKPSPPTRIYNVIWNMYIL